jgi:transcriptional regulator with XRE-family HTH domain
VQSAAERVLSDCRPATDFGIHGPEEIHAAIDLLTSSAIPFATAAAPRSAPASQTHMGRKPRNTQQRARHYLREWRIKSGLSLEAVTERLQAMSHQSSTLKPPSSRVGVTHGNLSRIERGLVPYNQTLLELLAQVYDTDTASLIAGPPADSERIGSLWESLTTTEKAQAVEIIKLLKGKRK